MNFVRLWICKCSKIVSHTCKSTAATEKLKVKNRVQLANATHWKSQLKMILNISPSKLDLLNCPKLSAYE